MIIAHSNPYTIALSHYALYYGRVYLPEPFRHLRSYLPEPFRQIRSYLPEALIHLFYSLLATVIFDHLSIVLITAKLLID